MSISMDLYNIKKYITSDKISVDEEIKNRLIDIIENTENNINNMSKKINTVRDQIRSTGNSEKKDFSIIKLVNAINLLIGSNLRINNCTLDIDIKEDIQLFGEENKLDRVLTNIINNSIDAYRAHESGGIITITAEKITNNCVIKVIDEAGGITEDIQQTLFKQIKTTKGDDGTGFGLYFANSIIMGDFKGKINFETKIGKGSTFIITIPL